MTLTATVSPSSATGLVSFYDRTTFLGGASLVSGTATLKTILLPAGTNSLTAFYAGDASHAASTSSTVSQTVERRSLDDLCRGRR